MEISAILEVTSPREVRDLIGVDQVVRNAAEELGGRVTVLGVMNRHPWEARHMHIEIPDTAVDGFEQRVKRNVMPGFQVSMERGPGAVMTVRQTSVAAPI